MLVSDKKEVLARLLARKFRAGGQPTIEMQRAAQQYGLSLDGSCAEALEAQEPARAQVHAPAERKRTKVAEANASSDGGASADPTPAGTIADNRLGGDPLASEESVMFILGSATPHAAGSALAHMESWAPSGNIRRLEAELPEVLRQEPLPRVNIPIASKAEKPPERLVDPPGPFTTDELIPRDCPTKVKQHVSAWEASIGRAGRGPLGWKTARALRPEALILEQRECLNSCGFGFTWQQGGDNLWRAMQPSSWPDDPPDTDIKPEAFQRLARECGLGDEQIVSWSIHGFPGARSMPTQRTVLGFPHVGALKNAASLEKALDKDVDAGFLCEPSSFPTVWPCVAPCVNVVVQHDKPRVTIDDSINLSSEAHPAPVAAYNDFVDLEAEREERGKLRLPRPWHFARAAAILQTSGLRVRKSKLDARAYFRRHGKQRMHVYQTTRIHRGKFWKNPRVDFGEQDAPDHCCAASDAATHFIRHELRRLDREYAPRDPAAAEWLAQRWRLAAATGEPDDPEFVWAVLGFFLMYVDDGGLETIDDAIIRSDGSNVLDSSDRQLMRPDLYHDAACGVLKEIGHDTPLDKQVRPRFDLIFLGSGSDELCRYLPEDKRKSYNDTRVELLHSGSTQPNGALRVQYDDANSLLHKLLHASEIIVFGRSHLHYVRSSLRGASGGTAFLSVKAQEELSWWGRQLAEPGISTLPLASRRDFPVSSGTTLHRYTDASREVGDDGSVSADNPSGFGGWAVFGEPQIFYYIVDKYSAHELRSYSINVLEGHASGACGERFAEQAEATGWRFTHSLAFIDNEVARFVNENGRTQTDGLHAVYQRRQRELLERGIHEASFRVTSQDNTIADDLSRQRVEEAVRHAKAAGFETTRLFLSEGLRTFDGIPPTWRC